MQRTYLNAPRHSHRIPRPEAPALELAASSNPRAQTKQCFSEFEVNFFTLNLNSPSVQYKTKEGFYLGTHTVGGGETNLRQTHTSKERRAKTASLALLSPDVPVIRPPRFQ